MRDQIDDRDYQFARQHMGESLERFRNRLQRVGPALREAFAVLNRIQRDAPWNAVRRRGHA